MELQPTTLALDALADAVRQHATPPAQLCLKFPFQSPLGGCIYQVELRRGTPGGGDERWLRGCIFWGGAEEAAPVDASVAFELLAAKEAATASGNLGATDAMLDGPFTDVALTAGSRTFRAHRVVLAAASPVFLSMLDGAVREGREAAV
ncbi:hypothetical protein Rsub_08268 [Raphidocelis subcapitata]|uniref:BTB domain-containing protein n=1 Tax=Raphidocelis subcapitata TaxID=307507 RepID=A0A2V0PA57_9CHLO|nr:hypothetical protein Rsub_08268 [Raphidocelis subcapitata]|eukprot:GBF95832.1 hypothetical protein Rsub_08268 [Raphidocelis subcapitata]